MDDDEYQLLDEINTETKKWRAKVIVISKSSFRLARDQKTKYQRLVLADKEGNCVDATIYDGNIDLYKKIIEQGETYIISNALIRRADQLYGSSLANTNFSWTINGSTYVSKVNNLSNNRSPLKKPMLEYEEYVTKQESLISTIVIIIDKKPSRETNKGDMVHEYIGMDKGCKPIIITLWNKPVSEETFFVLNSTDERPVVALIDFKVSSFYGTSLSSSTKSLVLTELNDPRFVEMKEWYLENVQKIDELIVSGELENKNFSTVSNDKIPIISICDVESYSTSKFLIIGEATLDQSEQATYVEDFLYICCERCHCKANATPNSKFSCTKGCNSFDRVAKWRYKLCLQVTDETGKLDVTVFGNNGEKFFNMTEEEFHEKYFKESKVCREKVDCKLENLKWRIRIKPSPFREKISYNVEEMVLLEEVSTKDNQVYCRGGKRKLNFGVVEKSTERGDEMLSNTGITDHEALDVNEDTINTTTFTGKTPVDSKINVKIEEDESKKKTKEGVEGDFSCTEGSSILASKLQTNKAKKSKAVSVVELGSDSEEWNEVLAVKKLRKSKFKKRKTN